MAKDTSLTVSLFGRDITLSDSLGKAGKSAKTTGQQIEAAGKKAAVVLAAVGGAAVLMAKAAAEDEKSSALLANTLKNVTGATTAQIKATEDYISKTTLATGITDDKIRPALARLTTATKNVGEAQKLTNLAMEIATAKNLDLETVANALGKAHDGNMGALKKLGVSLDETTVKNKDFEGAIKQLGDTFKGSLQAEAETAAGKMKRIENAMSEAKETIGYTFLPALTGLTDAFQKIAPFLTDHADIIGKIMIVVGGLAAVVVIITTAYKAYMAITKAMVIVQTAFNAVLAMNPIGLVVIAIAALVAGLVIAYQNSETFRNIVNGAFNSVKQVAETVANFIGNVFKTVFGGVKLYINSIISLANLAIRALNGINIKVPDWVPGFGGKSFGFNLPQIPMLANGGIVNRPTLAMIGEAGPEAVIPLSKSGGLGSNINIYVQGSVISERDLVYKVRDELGQLLRRKGAPISALGL